MGEGQYTVRVTVLVTAMNQQQQLVGVDTRRVSIAFSSTGGLSVISVIPIGWPGGSPLFSVPSTGYLEFIYSHWGPLIGGRWDIASNAGGLTIYVTELLTLG